MPAPHIVAVATATPRWQYDQDTLLRMAGYADHQRAGFFTNSQIERRHLYFDPATFTPDETVDELQERFGRGAIELGAEAVRRAAARAGWPLDTIDFLATTTCTGRLCPSLDARIIAELGLASRIQRVHVGDTGCASAMVALQQAVNHVRAFPAHRAIVVAVELCSAAYYLDEPSMDLPLVLRAVEIAIGVIARAAATPSASRSRTGRRGSRGTGRSVTTRS